MVTHVFKLNAGKVFFCEVQASLVYKLISRKSRATPKNPLKKKKQKKKEKEKEKEKERRKEKKKDIDGTCL